MTGKREEERGVGGKGVKVDNINNVKEGEIGRGKEGRERVNSLRTDYRKRERERERNVGGRWDGEGR